MEAADGGLLDQPLLEPLNNSLGPLQLKLWPPPYKTDLYSAYNQFALAPYCEYMEKCIVFRRAFPPPPLPLTLSFYNPGWLRQM